MYLFSELLTPVLEPPSPLFKSSYNHYEEHCCQKSGQSGNAAVGNKSHLPRIRPLRFFNLYLDMLELAPVIGPT